MPAELAVIVPVRDGAATLAATVDATVALFRAAAVEIDLLIVDDGSKDETPKVIASLVERHPEVRAMCSAAPGLSAARNTGPRSTSAPILGLIDADDVWLPPIASSALTLLRATDVPIVQGRARDLWCDSGREGLTYDMVGVGSMLFRRSTFDVVGGWDESLCIHEDYDWLLRAYDARVEKLRFDEAVLEYRRHSRGITAGGPTDPRTRIVVQRTALRRRRRGLPPLPAGFPSLASYLGAVGVGFSTA